MFRVRVDSSGLRRKVSAYIGAGKEARTRGIVTMASIVVWRAVADAPKDTRRFVRGWVLAGNAAGLDPMPVPVLQPPRKRDEIYKRLLRQAWFWAMIVRRYEQQARFDAWYQKAKRKLDRSLEELQKFERTEFGAVIAIGIRNRLGTKLRTVRDKIYGGTGFVVQQRDGAEVVLHNLEPHTSIVEARTHVMANASRAFRGAGIVMGRKAFVKALKDEAGVA